MNRTLILAVPLATIALAGCGGASTSSTSSSTSASAPATTGAATTAAFLAPAKTVSMVASTIPAKCDVNLYGIALVPATTGKLQAGNLLISNFNDKANNQGTGTTI